MRKDAFFSPIFHFYFIHVDFFPPFPVFSASCRTFIIMFRTPSYLFFLFFLLHQIPAVLNNCVFSSLQNFRHCQHLQLVFLSPTQNFYHFKHCIFQASLPFLPPSFPPSSNFYNFECFVVVSSFLSPLSLPLNFLHSGHLCISPPLRRALE